MAGFASGKLPLWFDLNSALLPTVFFSQNRMSSVERESEIILKYKKNTLGESHTEANVGLPHEEPNWYERNNCKQNILLGFIPFSHLRSGQFLPSFLTTSAVGHNQMYTQGNPHGSFSQSAFPVRNRMSLLLLDFSILTYSLRYMILTFNRLDDIGHILHRFSILLYSREGEK